MNPRGTESFDAAGVRYTAVFGFAAMAAVEAHYDLPFFQAIQRAMPQVRPEDAGDRDAIARAAMGVRISDVGALFGAALLKHHPDLTKDAIADLVDEVGLDKVGSMLGRVLSAAMVKDGEAGEGPRGNPPRPKPPRPSR